jgi:hypothetical protein
MHVSISHDPNPSSQLSLLRFQILTKTQKGRALPACHACARGPRQTYVEGCEMKVLRLRTIGIFSNVESCENCAITQDTSACDQLLGRSKTLQHFSNYAFVVKSGQCVQARSAYCKSKLSRIYIAVGRDRLHTCRRLSNKYAIQSCGGLKHRSDKSTVRRSMRTNFLELQLRAINNPGRRFEKNSRIPSQKA